MQYALVGLALAVFFLLLTALAEHLSFGFAYARRESPAPPAQAAPL